MTPAARYGAAIEILDQILDGTPAEKALTTWARRSRFAGSKDRAAIRDHVFDILRRKRSTAVEGGVETGRAMVLGLLRQEGIDPATVFTGEGHAPATLSEAEQAAGQPAEGGAALDLPEALLEMFRDSLGDDLAEYAEALRHRAPVMLRVNSRKLSRDAAIPKLAAEGIIAEVSEAAPNALHVTEGARKINNSNAYRDGLVELQDGASQAVAEALPLEDGQKVLDMCAGGGGKSLAMAARAKARFMAYDANAQRLRDLPERARRASAQIEVCNNPEGAAPFDLILCDVPCSGSGSWRRAPEGKWRMDADGLHDLTQLQGQILRRAADLVATGGTLAYATCSVLKQENDDVVASFLAENQGFSLTREIHWLPGADGDGFYLAILTAQ
ncbi:RsmB/NOP family class I SAM-dependent RNA methyltransferase [Thalassovita mediterranea]|jgi:16S rRNA (cytosine967-C5)-methyltransferase|uniref:Ribosomal RNA small subunit methyltransferase B n=1 Tax=Thalassovita mediterranea TaxID=340021 RepID=A0A0P1GQN8_9RHOB|nr:RsmB/NOP family class I SAM-dependent RNA methyltransferase [Thalassovita mediterranea]CUH84974.1 Ribosomal RNA small subunit methyltransferase B [Thalassovita mediterranea]SIS28901.1 16S rRNA (cytosine967-C5)-methyltransferase [Thalassovita mediterranea]